MEIPELVFDKEGKNLYHIYLFLIEDNKWWSFGHSAHYLSIMYPELEGIAANCEGTDESIPCVCVPEHCLMNLSDCYDTLASDAYIQVSAPPTVYCYRKEYGNWSEQLLPVNINSLY